QSGESVASKNKLPEVLGAISEHLNVPRQLATPKRLTQKRLQVYMRVTDHLSDRSQRVTL
ncbi:hypothetical protein, partial [Microcoleus sp. A006_D1]|uniref:hypothetical protein n=1 Tax=Microcoleus sp. A006_D1 TaxID=3055267 RepID=UPI002FD02B62